MHNPPIHPHYWYYSAPTCECKKCLKEQVRNEEIARQLEREIEFKTNLMTNGQQCDACVKKKKDNENHLNCHRCEGRGWLDK